MAKNSLKFDLGADQEKTMNDFHNRHAGKTYVGPERKWDATWTITPPMYYMEDRAKLADYYPNQPPKGVI